MTFSGWATIFGFVLILTALALPLGSYLAKVYTGQRVILTPVVGRAERLIYRILRVDPEAPQDWKQYAKSLIVFSLAGWLLLYLILRTQTLWDFTGLNPQHFKSGTWDLSFNTTSSFLTNTNWQYYGGETTLSYFSQMAGLTVQNFLSAGIGIIVAVALVRGIVGRSGKSLGNFWHDLVRTLLYVMLPISIVGAIILLSQGVIQNFGSYLTAHTLTGATQSIAMGPVASQEAIKELGTNGGGFFNVNSAHPFENPTAFTNFFEMLLVLIIPAALIFMYGRMTGNRRQGYAIYGVVMFMFLGAVIVAYIAEAHGSPAQHAAGIHTQAIAGSGGGNLEGKEQRFGIAGSALFNVITTVTSCGAVNSALESYTGIGGAVPFANLSASEVIFGGVGTGLYSILLYVLLAVFIGGLMVGRTPGVAGQEARGKGDQARGPGDPESRRWRRCSAPRWEWRRARARNRSRKGRWRRAAATRRRASRRPSTRTSRRRTTTARRSRATPATSSRTPATRAPTASRSRTCSAASTCSSPATGRSSSPSPSRARSPASASPPPASARCAPTTPPSRCC